MSAPTQETVTNCPRCLRMHTALKRPGRCRCTCGRTERIKQWIARARYTTRGYLDDPTR